MAARVDCYEFELGGDGENRRLVLGISFVLISGVGSLNSRMGVEWCVASRNIVLRQRTEEKAK
jgi:hypothetical protein